MTHDIPELDRRGLREFGLVTGAAFWLLFGLLFPWLLARPSPYWPWILGGALVLFGLVVPNALQTVYRFWMRLALLMSRITTPIIMGVVFFLLITPIALIMRVMRHDPMARRFEQHTATYRIASRKPPKTHMERPF